MRAKKTDLTHQSIRDELRIAGFSVADTSRLGDDFPDLVAGKHGITLLIEVKTPRGRKTAQERLSDGQITFAETWRGGPVIAAYCAKDVIYRFNSLLRSKGWVK